MTGKSGSHLRLIAAIGLACGAHVAAFAMVPRLSGSDSGAGEAGEALVSLQAASGEMQELVAQWDSPPQIADLPDLALSAAPQTELAPPDPPMAPSADTLPQTQSPALLPVPPQADALAKPPLAPAPMPLPEAPPDLAPLAQVAIVPLSIPDAATDPVPQITADAAPPVPVQDVAPQSMPAPPPPAPPATKPKPRPKVAQTTPQPKATAKAKAAPKPTSNAPSAGQKATGAGNGAVAGTGGTAKSTTLSKARLNDLKAGWGASIRARIEARKRYPADARGASGKVTLRLSVNTSGQLTAVAIAASSGNAALDRAALKAVQSAGRFVAAPKGLSEPSYSFTLPMSFAR